MTSPSSLDEVLHAVFGLKQFRSGQREILQDVIDGKDVMAVMPTGGGKSLCYQLPASLRPGITLVVSPLIALMRDQVSALKALRIPCGCLHSGQSVEDKRAVFRQMKGERSFLLYLSPERVQKAGFVQWFKQAPVSLIAIDEAHCVSQWGPDFREDYYRLKELREARAEVPILALTASATPEVLFDIKKQLKLRDPGRHVYGFYRPNLYIQVEACFDDGDKERWITQALRQITDGRVIIYGGTRKRCENLAAFLGEKFAAVDFYHAGVNAVDRSEKQKRFETGQTRILCATNAFGMGIDCPDVRLLIHDKVPANIESYYQEAGRSGRDGKNATCLLLYSKRDKGLHSYFIQQSKADRDTKNKRWRALEVMIQFSEGGECRHAEILTYFRDQKRIDACGHCDTCSPQSVDRISAPHRVPITAEKLVDLEGFRRELRARKKLKEKERSEPMTPEQLARVKIVQNWRKSYAQKQGVPAFLIFSNRTLEALVRQWPSSTAHLENVYGIGPHKVESFGQELVELVKAHSPPCA